ncbi:MAG: hypothetical protein ACC630_00470 [Nitrospinota bacterium]
MRNSLITILIITFFMVTPKKVCAGMEDKVIHFGLSALGQYSLSYVLIEQKVVKSETKGKLISAIIILGLGAIKEFVIDEEPDWGDMGANGGGVALAFFIKF